MRHLALALFPLSSACIAPTSHPTLDDVDLSVDPILDLVDRSMALDGAVENERGTEPDLANAPAAFHFQIDGSELSDTFEASGKMGVRAGAPTYRAIVDATVAVVAADVVSLAVVGPPALAVEFASNGELTEQEPWLWSATNTTEGVFGNQTTFDLDVVWVGVGWLAEMRYSDNTHDDELWFNGFLSVESAVGWWDIYDNDEIVGIVEWTALGNNDFQSAIAAVGAHENAGDVLLYGSNQDDEYTVRYYDASEDFESYVELEADQSGEVALLGVNMNQPQCWNTEWADVDCP